MKKKRLTFLFIILILSFRLNSYATSYIVFSNTLNIRSGPGTSFHIIGKLNRGDKIEVIEETNEWAQIEWMKEAWIYKKYIRTPGSIKGIGVSYDQVMNKLHDYFTMEKTGEDRYLGTFNDLAILHITGNKKNITKTSIILGVDHTKIDDDDYFKKVLNIVCIFFRNVAPEIKDPLTWFNRIMKKAVRNDCKPIDTYQGIKKVSMSACPTVGLLSIAVERDNSKLGESIVEEKKIERENKGRKAEEIIIKELLDSFILVPGGCYMMGNSMANGPDFPEEKSEKPVHKVCLDGFFIGKYEVTVEQYRVFLMQTGETSGVDWNDEACPLKKNSSYSLSGNKFGFNGKQPMVEVSWSGAKAFCDWLSRTIGKTFRLPTEAEWEYAARSCGKNELYAGGGSIKDLAWYIDNSEEKTHIVGTKSPNGLGIYDMSGNVWEWCQDWYGEDYYSNSPVNNPIGPSSGTVPLRVTRGGSWCNGPWGCRTAQRGFYDPMSEFLIQISGIVGFRLVMLPGQE